MKPQTLEEWMNEYSYSAPHGRNVQRWEIYSDGEVMALRDAWLAAHENAARVAAEFIGTEPIADAIREQGRK